MKVWSSCDGEGRRGVRGVLACPHGSTGYWQHHVTRNRWHPHFYSGSCVQYLANCTRLPEPVAERPRLLWTDCVSVFVQFVSCFYLTHCKEGRKLLNRPECMTCWPKLYLYHSMTPVLTSLKWFLLLLVILFFILFQLQCILGIWEM